MPNGYVVQRAIAAVAFDRLTPTKLSGTAPAGLITIPLEEEQGGTTPLRGNYVLYLRVERK